MAWSIRVLKSSAVIPSSTAFMASSSSVLPLATDMLRGKLEVAFGAGEVEHDEVRVVCCGGGGGGQVGADEVHRAGLELHDHGGGGLRSGLDLGIGDLGQTGVVPDGTRLGGAAAARQVGDALGGGVGTAGGGEAYDVGVVVGAHHVHLGHTVGGHGLARDGHVDGAALEGGDEGIPGGGNHLQLPAVGVTDALGDHHIIAVGIGPRHVGDAAGGVDAAGAGL